MAEESGDSSSGQSRLKCHWSLYANENEKSKMKSLKTDEMFLSAASSSIDVSDEGQGSSKAFDLQQQVNSSSFVKAQFSTPKNCQSSDGSNPDKSTVATNESEFSITNPFENQSTIDSLLQPSMSPSIFDSVTNNTLNKPGAESPESFWNIDQIAIMNPVDIDLSKLHEQQNFVKFDPTMEMKAQKAIDSFFATGVNISSPWSSADKPHYLAIISPAVPSSSKKKTVRYRDPIATPKAVSVDVPLVEKGESTASNGVTVGIQTQLSIPWDIDLSKLLANYISNEPMVSKPSNDTQANEVLSNSSLRRKLFFHDLEDTEYVENFCSESNQCQTESHVEKASEDLDVFPMMADSCNEQARGNHAKTPLLKSKCSIPKTPSSCQSLFSSSPVTGGRMFDLGTPCDSRRVKEMKNDCFSPGPEYSPISCTRSNVVSRPVSAGKTPCRSYVFDKVNDSLTNFMANDQQRIELNSCNISSIRSDSANS